jgi:cytochrome c oxidase cbb3-type subunit III
MGLRAVTGLLLAAAACGRSDGEAPAARAAIRYDQHVLAGATAPAGDTLRNPMAGDSAAAALGGQLFTSMNCDGCHGGGATGWAAPSLIDGRWRYGGSDAALFHSVFYGRPRGMPAYGGVMDEASIWRVVTWLASQPVPVTVPTQAWR